MEIYCKVNMKPLMSTSLPCFGGIRREARMLISHATLCSSPQ